MKLYVRILLFIFSLIMISGALYLYASTFSIVEYGEVNCYDKHGSVINGVTCEGITNKNIALPMILISSTFLVFGVGFLIVSVIKFEDNGFIEVYQDE